MNKFWLNPTGTNKPDNYEKGEEKSRYLSKVINKLPDVDSALELGCNVGRNLKYLETNSSINHLYGIEINKEAAERAASKYLSVIHGNIETTEYPPVELIFTMAVLVHIPDEDIGKVVSNINRSKAKYLITIEDEHEVNSDRHYPRNYQDLFSPDWQQIWMDIPTQKSWLNMLGIKMVKGLNRNYVTRVFERASV